MSVRLKVVAGLAVVVMAAVVSVPRWRGVLPGAGSGKGVEAREWTFAGRINRCDAGSGELVAADGKIMTLGVKLESPEGTPGYFHIHYEVDSGRIDAESSRWGGFKVGGRLVCPGNISDLPKLREAVTNERFKFVFESPGWNREAAERGEAKLVDVLPMQAGSSL